MAITGAELLSIIFFVLILVMVSLAAVIWLIFDRKRSNREPF